MGEIMVVLEIEGLAEEEFKLRFGQMLTAFCMEHGTNIRVGVLSESGKKKVTKIIEEEK